MTLLLTGLSVLHGMLDFYRTPSSQRDWHGPLNGQLERQKLVLTILHRLDLASVVETGSFRGCTTEFFSSLTSLPVHSVESNSRNHGYAKARLWGRQNCFLHLGSSEAVLPMILAQYTNIDKPVFFYLDAHWDDYLPLRDEISLIAQACPNFIALIDDFEVPGDADYHWDDYGTTGQLKFPYISDLVIRFGLNCWYPKVSSSEETGARRGSILLSSASVVEAVESLPGLRVAV